MIKNDINLQKLKNAINDCKPPALKAGEQFSRRDFKIFQALLPRSYRVKVQRRIS